jgi:hypothetical protein
VKGKEVRMNHRQDLYAELEKQHYAKLSKEAENERLVQNLVVRDDQIKDRKEVSVMLKRRLAAVAAVAIITVILIAQNVAAASGPGGGGGFNLVM